MFGFLYPLYYLVINTVVDFIFFILIDVVVKLSLKDASDESEKRIIWLYESVVLLVFATLFYIFHHTPYVLFILGITTLLYTQLLGRINFRYWWWQLVNSWDEFEQHEESMEAYHHRQAHGPGPPSQPLVTAAQPTRSHFMPQANVGMGIMSNPMNMEIGARPGAPVMPSYEAWYPVDVDRSGVRPMGNPHVVMSEPQMMPPGPVRFRPPMPHPNAAYYPTQMTPVPRFNPVMPRGAELGRKPIHSYLATPNKSANLQPDTGLSTRLKSTFLSAFGMNTQSSNALPGLKNNGHNLCFMNSVLQCVAHSPAFLDYLGHESQKVVCVPGEQALVDTVTELLAALSVAPGTSQTTIVDTNRLRGVLSSIPNSVVIDPYGSKPQSQQDAAEYLMWLLDALHSALNVQKNHNPTSFAQGQPPVGRMTIVRYAALTLNMLKFIYGDLTPYRVAELKAACRNEIEQANGLDSDSYAEPIQRLSDLEWLTYKENNSSVVDDLFTGQLVESQHCVACNRISVEIQTFSILPVPLVEPRQPNGLVYLEDCFTKFGNIEDLFGPDGLQCECCNKPADGVVTRAAAEKAGHQAAAAARDRRTVFQESAALSASPVLVNGGERAAGKGGARRRFNHVQSDSAVYSTNSPGITMASSTPMSPIPVAVGGDVFSDSGFHDNQYRTSTPIGAALPARLTDGQRRSLLRQLPECLIVQLMRFSMVEGRPKKVQRAISVPLFKLDLTHLIIDNVMHREDLTTLNACFQYDLYGVCVHLGSDSTAHGHYISYALASDGSWYKFDDEVVTPVNMSYELNTRQIRENAYLLFYRKTDMGQ